MEPVTVDLTDALAKLLQSGGSAATVVIVWIALRLKTAVEGYLKGLNETLAKLTAATTKLSEQLDRIEQQRPAAMGPPRLVERRSDP